MTGDPSREAYLGLDFLNQQGQRRYAFSAFTFPACQECNSAFAALEGQAKGVVTRMLAHNPLGASDLEILLDWLDKVRVGLWLAGIYLNKNYQGVEPSFYIQSRVGAFDRLLLVYRIQGDGWQGVNWVGADSPIFHLMPSCFSLTINDLCLLSVSCDFLLARQVGFPFPTERYVLPSMKHGIGLSSGTGFHQFPVLDYKFRSGARFFWQPMVSWSQIYGVETASQVSESVYKTEYVRSSCADFEKGRGFVFTNHGSTPAQYPSELSNDWQPSRTMPRRDFMYRNAADVHRVLELLYRNQPDLGLLPADDQEAHQKSIDLCLGANRAMIANIESQRRMHPPGSS